MANLKFSDFTPYATTPLTATSGLVAYEGTTNIRFSPAELAPFTGVYAADGTIGTTRKALITDTIQFRDSGDSYDILKLHTDGTFALGRGATTTINNQVAIGNGVTASGSFDVAIGYASTASAGGGMAIGRSASSNANGIALGFTAASASGGLAIGYASKNYVTSAAGEVYGIALGFSCTTGATSVGIGDNIDISTATNAIAIGSKASSTGNNSITFNSNGTAVSATTANAFGVYMSSNTTPDFQVHHDGNSYITGEGKFGINKSNPLATLDVVHYDATRKLVSFNNASATEVFSLEDNECRIGPAGNSAWKLGIGVAATADAKVKILHGTYHDVGLRITGRSGIDAYKPLQIHDGTNVELFSVTSAGTVKITGQAYTALYANATNLVVDWSDSNTQTVTISTSVPVFAPNNPKAGATYILIIEQGATPVTVDWNSLVKWPSATGAPTLSAVTGKIDVITLICYNDSGSGLYYGSATLDLA